MYINKLFICAACVCRAYFTVLRKAACLLDYRANTFTVRATMSMQFIICALVFCLAAVANASMAPAPKQVSTASPSVCGRDH